MSVGKNRSAVFHSLFYVVSNQNIVYDIDEIKMILFTTISFIKKHLTAYEHVVRFFCL